MSTNGKLQPNNGSTYSEEQEPFKVVTQLPQLEEYTTNDQYKESARSNQTQGITQRESKVADEHEAIDEAKDQMVDLDKLPTTINDYKKLRGES